MTDGPVVVGSDERAEDLVPIDVARWSALARFVLEREGVGLPAELNIHFVDVDEIAVLNREHLGGSGPTDVLAFPVDDPRTPLGDGELRLLGDVVVCPTVVREQAGSDPDDEMALMIVHGVLHILGMDHAEPDEREAMQAAEQRHLDRWNAQVRP